MPRAAALASNCVNACLTPFTSASAVRSPSAPRACSSMESMTQPLRAATLDTARPGMLHAHMSQQHAWSNVPGGFSGLMNARQQPLFQRHFPSQAAHSPLLQALLHAAPEVPWHVTQVGVLKLDIHLRRLAQRRTYALYMPRTRGNARQAIFTACFCRLQRAVT